MSRAGAAGDDGVPLQVESKPLGGLSATEPSTANERNTAKNEAPVKSAITEKAARRKGNKSFTLATPEGRCSCFRD